MSGLPPATPSAPIAFVRRLWTDIQSRRRIILGLGLICAYVGGLGFGSWTRVCAGNRCPSISALLPGAFNPTQTSKVYAADGRLITELGIERRTVLPLAQMPAHLKNAFIAVEDKRFYSHHGIDFLRFFGALKANILTLSWSQGFSTITMQLARNVFPEKIPRTKRVTRKLMEARVAIEIEHSFSKDQILELYLNQILLGGGVYGVESAAQAYFGKNARDLNVAEAAMLAALPKNPEGYNPRKHPGRAVRRRNVIINLMRDQGYLTPEEAEHWKAYPLVLSGRTDYRDVAPYFVEWVRRQLDARFGRDLYQRGLRIYTTLDLDMQEAAERAVRQQLEAIEAGAYSPGGQYPHPTYGDYVERGGGGQDQAITPYLQAAFMAIEARTGYVRALVGGRDYGDSKYNRATQAQRQAGSTFKPFVYAAAVRNGHAVTELLDDSPLSTPLIQEDSSYWNPRDYDDTTLGFIPMRRSLFESRNLSTIKLGMQLGEPTVIGEARRFGVTTPLPPFPAIHIGAASVYLSEMVEAYSAFANLGTRVEPIFIEKVEDQQGNILWQPTIRREQVMDEPHAWLMLDMLRDVIRRGTAYGAVTAAGFRLPAGGKTGTTDTYTDAWFVGFTPDLVAGVWVGFDLPQPILPSSAGGSRMAAPAWTMFMREVYDRRPAPADWARSDSLVIREVDWDTGFLYTPFCPVASHKVEFFVPGTEPTKFCPVHSPFGGGVSNR